MTMRIFLLATTMVALIGSPTRAEEFRIQESPPTYYPWLAAGLTYVPMVPGAVAATITTDPANPLRWRDSIGFAAVNPMPGLGHIYVGEPLRGISFLATNLGLLGVTLLANGAMYEHPRSDSHLVWKDQVRGGVTLTYIVTSTALSAWAAWDAYRIAEEKNR